MKKGFFVLIVIGLLAVVAIACAAGPQAGTQTGAGSSTAQTKAAWEGKWEAALAEARKEGSLNIYAIWKVPVRTAVTQAFKEKYGITIEFSPFSRGEELLTKVQTEQRAGQYLADVFGGGAGATLGLTMKRGGVLGTVKPLLILPEVLEPAAWRGGRLPFNDEDGTAFNMISAVIRGVAYNTDMVKEGELKSIKDLLKPQYQGKITLNDPSLTGMLNDFLTNLGMNVWDEEETTRFLRQLVREQGAVVQRDIRLHAESVARGKYAVGVGPNAEVTAQFVAEGAPLKVAMLEEDNYLIGSSGGVGVPTKFAHPNAAIVFVNWLLTKEGQSVYATSFGSPSTRLDASTEGISPIFVPAKDKKYYLENEAFVAGRAKYLKIAKDIIEEAAK